MEICINSRDRLTVYEGNYGKDSKWFQVCMCACECVWERERMCEYARVRVCEFKGVWTRIYRTKLSKQQFNLESGSNFKTAISGDEPR